MAKRDFSFFVEAIITHHPMQHVQGYTGSHWTPSLGGYLLRIVPAAAKVTDKQTTMKTCTYFAGHFGGHGKAPVC
jgi:hypothetical protein